MTPAVVSASCHPPKAGAVLGVPMASLVPMAAWVPLGRLGGFVRGTFRFLLPPLLRVNGTERPLSQGPVWSNGGAAGLKHDVQT